MITHKASDPRQSEWEKMGKPITSTRPRQMLKECGLDWEPTIVPTMYQYLGTTKTSETTKLLVNSKTGEEISAISSKWVPMGNRDFLNKTIRLLETIGLGAENIARGGYSHGSSTVPRVGDRCSFLLSDEIPELGFNLFGDKKEYHSTRLMALNPQYVGAAISVKLITVRLVCLNGMVSTGVGNDILNVYHNSKSIKNMSNQDVLVKNKQLIEIRRLVLEELAKVKISKEEAIEHFVELVGDRSRAINDQPVAVKILERIYNGAPVDTSVAIEEGVDLSLNDYTHNTAYGVVNAVTAYMTHVRGRSNPNYNPVKVQNFSNVAPVTKIMSSLERAYVPKHLWQQEQLKATQAQSVRAF
jgi:hypothetical protein